MIKKILIAVVVALVVIQVIPVERTNPAVTQDLNPPENISVILRTSCYDCHSNETKWPWYAYVAPVSFLVTGDVSKGRKHLNFSEWDKYDEKKRDKILEEIMEEVEAGGMPLSNYIITHPEAKLEQSEIAELKEWVISGGGEAQSLRYKKNVEKD
jgi:hypothetical protein